MTDDTPAEQPVRCPCCGKPRAGTYVVFGRGFTLFRCVNPGCPEAIVAPTDRQPATP